MSEQICFVLGCGDTGMFMPGGHCYTIGVNDAGRFGKSLDALLFLNRPRHFNEPALYVSIDITKHHSRFDIIKATKVKQVLTLETLVREWEEVFPGQVRSFSVTRWTKTLQQDQVYHTDNSPFSAMSYAVTQGFKEIVLWGVDFNNHRYLKAVTSAPVFSQYAVAARKFDVTIYKGHSDQNLNLPLWGKH